MRSLGRRRLRKDALDHEATVCSVVEYKATALIVHGELVAKAAVTIAYWLLQPFMMKRVQFNIEVANCHSDLGVVSMAVPGDGQTLKGDTFIILIL